MYYINEEINQSECNFWHTRICNSIPYLHFADKSLREQLAGLELNLKINANYIKSSQIFFVNKRDLQSWEFIKENESEK